MNPMWYEINSVESEFYFGKLVEPTIDGRLGKQHATFGTPITNFPRLPGPVALNALTDEANGEEISQD